MQLIGITKQYGGKPVLAGVDFCFPEGKTTCLLGPSGRGKTTVLRLLAGLEQPDAGHASGVGARKLSMVFQEDRLLSSCTAAQNLQIAAPGCDAMAWLSRVGLAADAEKYPGQLSGGMRRRVALARALAYDGDVYLLDEPFKGIDARQKHELLALVRGHIRGKTAVLVTHDEQEAAALADTVVRL